LDNWVPLFDENGYLFIPAASPDLQSLLLDAPAGAPDVVAPANPCIEPPPARARALSKCSLCLAAGITCTTHTKAKCHRNPAAVNAVVLDGGPLPLALDHRPLEGNFVHGAAQHAAPILPLNSAIAPLLALDAAGYSSGGSSDTEAPAAGSGDDSDSSQEADVYLPFAQAAWTPYVMQEQVALLNPWYPSLRSRDAVDGVVEGPEPPPVVPMFGGEVPPFTKANEKGASRNIPRSCKTAWDFIDLLFDEADWERLCTYTNLAATTMVRHAGKRRLHRWKPVTTMQMKMFFAISSFLGVVQLQNRKEAWSRSSIFGQNFLHGCVSLARFEAIVSCLHYEDSWSMGAEALKAANEKDCFWQIHGLVDHVSRQAKIYWQMGRKISVDEAVIPFKGRHKGRCYNPSKPAKYHFKTYAMNDADTGYQYHSYYYRGKEETRPADVPATMWPVVTMVMQSPDVHNAGHVLVTDNWYTQPQLAHYLKGVGIEAVGTCKTNRLCVITPTRLSGFPRGGIFKAKYGGKKERGFSMVHETTLGGRTYYVTSWQDKKGVYILSTYPPSEGTCFRKVKMGNKWTEQKLPRPSVIRHYNAGMGGTDLHDQRLSAFRSTLKSRRWQVRALTNTFQSVCMNAYILQTQHMDMGKSYTSLDFIKNMISECCSMQQQKAVPRRADDAIPAAFDRHKREYWEANSGERCQGRHFLHAAEGQVRPTEGNERKRPNNRRNCMVCGNLGLSFCRQCGVHLCMGECNETFHTCANF
jgi:hypothetical protein